MSSRDVPGGGGGGGRVTFARSSGVSDLSIALKPYQELIVSPRLLWYSTMVLRLGIFVTGVVGTVEQPNYPIMVTQGAHPDSFPNTEPFGFSAATFFVPMTTLLGATFASVAMGKLSDVVGRKPCILVCLYGTAVGCVLKYLLRKSFWPYCAMNFVTGLFSVSGPVGLAYAGDVNETKREKDAEIGLLVGAQMLGWSGGGVIAILMEDQGLFFPLIAGAILAAVSAVLCTFMLIEPKDILASRARGREEDALVSAPVGGDDDGLPVPTELDYRVFGNIILGAVGDNIGSSGLMPLCMTPLAFKSFYQDFEDLGEDPIMSQVGYKWITVVVALMVIPGAIISAPVYNRVGLAGGCVLGNVITGVVTIALLYLALAPPTEVTFGIFVALLYTSFPATVFSQLSTGPMLEATSPPDKRGFCQGVNMTVMNFGWAVSPFVLGVVADTLGTPTAIWICAGISFLAALINVPLIWVKGCSIPPKPRPAELKPLVGEDKEMVERALRGEWIPMEELDAINENRFNAGQPFLIVHPRSYQEDKAEIGSLRRRARADLLYQQNKAREHLNFINTSEDLASVCDRLNAGIRSSDQDEVDQINREIGQWIVDYMVDSGYNPQLNSVLIKQQILSSFPVVGSNPREEEEGYTPDNIEESFLKLQRVYARLVEMEGYDDDERRFNTTRILQHARGTLLGV